MVNSGDVLKELENESIEILRETAAAFKNPVMLYSIGKDSSVLLHLARKAFHPGRIPFKILHIDTTWKFREMIEFRDQTAIDFDLDLLVHTNQDGVAEGANPFTLGASEYTRIMKTVALRQALDMHGFDAALGGSRRDEERSRAKERIFSVREPGHRWDPRNQRQELWRTYNPLLAPEKSESTNFGVQFSPSFLKGLSLSVDLYSVEVTNRIGQPATPAIMLANPQLFPDAIVRAAPTATDTANGLPGELREIRSVLGNYGSTKAEGVDFAAEYRFAPGRFGRVTARAAATQECRP